MYVECSACFDPNSMQESLAEDGCSQTHVPNSTPTRFSVEELSYHDQNPSQEDNGVASAATTMDIEIQQQLGVNIDHSHSATTAAAAAANNHQSDTHLMPEVVHDYNHVFPNDQTNWDPNVHDMQNMFNHYNQQDQYLQQIDLTNAHLQHHHHVSENSLYPPTADLLNLFHLPRCSASTLLPNSSISFSNPTQKAGAFPSSLGHLGELPAADTASGSTVLYDTLLPLNLPLQPPLLRELIQSLPHGYNLSGSRTGSLFGGIEDREASGGVYHDGDGGHFDNEVLDFGRDINCMGKGSNGKDTKHFATEKQRREQMNGKFQALRSLVPNPTKGDRASIVGDAIDYIKELRRTVHELTLLVEKKRRVRERIKRHKTEDDAAATAGEIESSNTKPPGGDPDQAYNGTSLRSSWLQRKSKNTEVDVRIIDDEVTIKLVQQKRINCLLFVSKVLDELQLDLHHVAGGLIGDHYSYLFNTKICEGSSVYASAIASKLIDVVDRQYAAIPPTSSY